MPFGREADEFLRLSDFGVSLIGLRLDAEIRERMERPDLADDAVSVLESASPFLDLEGWFPMVYMLCGKGNGKTEVPKDGASEYNRSMWV